MKSILQTKKRCFICNKANNLHEHHIYFGSAKRKISEVNGFKCWLCLEHHIGTFGVHGIKGYETDKYLKKVCQMKYEETHSREEFMKLIGRNYL